MKRILIFTTLALCVLFLASCNIQERLEGISDNLKGQIIDMAGQFIEKNPETDISQSSSSGSSTDLQPDIPSDIPSDDPNGNAPIDPPVPETPDYVILERENYPLNKYVGINITKANRDITLSEYKFSTLYGYGRYITTIEDVLDSDSNPFLFFKLNGMESTAVLDFDLTKSKQEAEEGERSFAEIAEDIWTFADKFCSSSALLSNVQRIEIGSRPNVDISAKDYALLLNTIYDDNSKQNGEDIGTNFIDHQIRLVTGKMSTVDVNYVKELMNEIKAGRNDEFLPLGGWSFSISTQGKSPELAFAQNDALKELITYRNENYESIEIYLNDFGWDTVNANSQNYIASTADGTSEQLQAMYILRSYLILNAMGVDKSAYIAINDTAENGEGVIKANGDEKLSFYAMEFFKEKMDGMYLESIESFGENNVFHLKYSNNNGKTISAIWSTDGSQTTELPGNCTVSTFNKTTGKYVTEELTDNDSPATYQLNQYVIFVESFEAVQE